MCVVVKPEFPVQTATLPSEKSLDLDCQIREMRHFFACPHPPQGSWSLEKSCFFLFFYKIIVIRRKLSIRLELIPFLLGNHKIWSMVSGSRMVSSLSSEWFLFIVISFNYHGPSTPNAEHLLPIHSCSFPNIQLMYFSVKLFKNL